MTERARKSTIETGKAVDFWKAVGDKSIFRIQMRLKIVLWRAKMIVLIFCPETGERLRFGKRVGLWIAYTYALEKKAVFRLYFAVL